jgi:parvulin-like peptidyl-prolyl isomerase
VKRSLLAPVALVALLLAVPALAGCDEANPDALEVNGTTFSQSSVDDELQELADNETLEAAFGAQNESDGTVNSALTAFWLSEIVRSEVATQELDRAGVEVTDADREQGAALLEQTFSGAQDVTAADIVADFPQSFQDDVTDRNAALVAFDRAVTDGDIELADEVVEDALELATDGCESGRFVSHILVDTQAEADALLVELDGGADFAELAAESSTDGSAAQGGFLGCYEPGSFVQEFDDATAAAEPGEVTQPVQTEFGFHLILVDEAPPEAQVTADSLNLLVRLADVTVDPRYGDWDAEAGQVVAPTPVVAPTTTVPTLPTSSAP